MSLTTAFCLRCSICYENKRRCLDKLERSIASGLQQVFAVVEKLIGSILATTQDKTDFIGSETNMSLSCSRACRKCIEYLQPLVTTICQVLVRPMMQRLVNRYKPIFSSCFDLCTLTMNSICSR